MTETSLPRGAGKAEDASGPSTQEIVVDGRYARLLAEDLGIKETTARTAFIGEPKVRCIRVVEWAMRHEPDDAEKRAKMILAWARKRKAGAFRDDPDAERWLARKIGEYWAENPEKLAETLREVMADNGAA